jgi:hypothetical protein
VYILENLSKIIAEKVDFLIPLIEENALFLNILVNNYHHIKNQQVFYLSA